MKPSQEPDLPKKEKDRLLILSLCLIFLSLAIYNLHLFFEKDSDRAWYIYFISERIVFFACYAYIFYLQVIILKWKYPLIHAIWLLWILLAGIDLLQEIFGFNSYQIKMEIMIFLLSLITGLYLFYWSKKNIKGIYIDELLDINSLNELSPNYECVYILFYKPKTFFGFILSTPGHYVHGVKMFIRTTHEKINIYGFSGRTNKFIKEHVLPKNYIAILLPIKDIGLFHNYCENLLDTKWHWRKRNCLTVYKYLLPGFGIKLNTIFPSIFLKQLLKQTSKLGVS